MISLLKSKTKYLTVSLIIFVFVTITNFSCSKPHAFDDQYYHPINLSRAVREQYGETAILVTTGKGLFDWKAQIGNELKPVNLRSAVDSQYGSDWSLVAVGLDKDDWRAVNFSEPEYSILPVMLVASDRVSDPGIIRLALYRLRSVLTNVQNWYQSRVNATFKFLQPIVIPTDLTSAQWNELSNITFQDEHRYDLLKTAINYFSARLPQPGNNLRVVIIPYSGASAEIWLGAACSGNFVVVPPRATSLDCPPSGPLDSKCADASYAVGHELGHTFSLGHSCDIDPGNKECHNSIMQTGKPPTAILLSNEIAVLQKSPFFFRSVVIGP